jgi:hypothetical protein
MYTFKTSPSPPAAPTHCNVSISSSNSSIFIVATANETSFIA